MLKHPEVFIIVFHLIQSFPWFSISPIPKHNPESVCTEPKHGKPWKEIPPKERWKISIVEVPASIFLKTVIWSGQIIATGLKRKFHLQNPLNSFAQIWCEGIGCNPPRIFGVLFMWGPVLSSQFLRCWCLGQPTKIAGRIWCHSPDGYLDILRPKKIHPVNRSKILPLNNGGWETPLASKWVRAIFRSDVRSGRVGDSLTMTKRIGGLQDAPGAHGDWS